MTKCFVREEGGAAGVEYTLLLAFVVLMMVTFDPTVKAAVGNTWNIIATQLLTAVAQVVFVCPSQVRKA